MKFIYLVEQDRNCPCGAVEGVAGDARTILNGSGAPASTLGKDGDYYIDNSNTYLYGP